MSLHGAKLICLDESDAHGQTINAKGRKFTIGYCANNDYVIEGPNSKGIHCEISCDSLGRVTIHNLSKEHPACLNDVPLVIKKPLLSGSKITILGKHYLWDFPKATSSEYEDIDTEEMSTPQKQVDIPKHSSGSCPNLKFHQYEVERRFTVHNFAHCIQSDEEGNVTIDSDSAAETSATTTTTTTTPDNPKPDADSTQSNPIELVPIMEDTAIEQRCVTPEPTAASKPQIVLSDLTPKTNIINCTMNKENTSTHKKQQLLSMCQQSHVVITSFSPRETGVRIEKSFTAVLKPATPRSVYSTPKSMSDTHDEGSRELMEFSTPATSKKTNTKLSRGNVSMHLVDYTTPNKLTTASPHSKSALKMGSSKKQLSLIAEQGAGDTPTQKRTNFSLALSDCGISPLCTPSVAADKQLSDVSETPDSVVSVDSSDSSSVVEISDDGLSPAVVADASSSLKTPKKTGAVAKTLCTPKRTPQSLMKRALLTSAKKQTTPARTTTSASANVSARKSLAATSTSPAGTPSSAASSRAAFLARRQSLSTPTRKVFIAGRLKPDGTPPTTSGASCSSSALSKARRSLCPTVGRTLATSTPLGRSTSTLRTAVRTSPLHKVRKSFGGSPLTSHISKARKSVAMSSRFSTSSNSSAATTSSASTPTSSALKFQRRSVCVTPANARAKALAAAATPTSILKDPLISKKRVDPKKAVLFADKQREQEAARVDLSRTFTLDSDEEAVEASHEVSNTTPKNVTFSPVKEKKEGSVLNVTFSPEKPMIHDKPNLVPLGESKQPADEPETSKEKSTHTATVDLIDSDEEDSSPEVVIVDLIDTPKKSSGDDRNSSAVVNIGTNADDSIIETLAPGEESDDLLEQIEELLNKSDEMEKQKQKENTNEDSNPEPTSEILEDIEPLSEELVEADLEAQLKLECSLKLETTREEKKNLQNTAEQITDTIAEKADGTENITQTIEEEISDLSEELIESVENLEEKVNKLTEATNSDSSVDNIPKSNAESVLSKPDGTENITENIEEEISDLSEELIESVENLEEKVNKLTEATNSDSSVDNISKSNAEPVLNKPDRTENITENIEEEISDLSEELIESVENLEEKSNKLIEATSSDSPVDNIPKLNAESVLSKPDGTENITENIEEEVSDLSGELIESVENPEKKTNRLIEATNSDSSVDNIPKSNADSVLSKLDGTENISENIEEEISDLSEELIESVKNLKEKTNKLIETTNSFLSIDNIPKSGKPDGTENVTENIEEEILDLSEELIESVKNLEEKTNKLIEETNSDSPVDNIPKLDAESVLSKPDGTENITENIEEEILDLSEELIESVKNLEEKTNKLIEATNLDSPVDNIPKLDAESVLKKPDDSENITQKEEEISDLSEELIESVENLEEKTNKFIEARNSQSPVDNIPKLNAESVLNKPDVAENITQTIAEDISVLSEEIEDIHESLQEKNAESSKTKSPEDNTTENVEENVKNVLDKSESIEETRVDCLKDRNIPEMSSKDKIPEIIISEPEQDIADILDESIEDAIGECSENDILNNTVELPIKNFSENVDECHYKEITETLTKDNKETSIENTSHITEGNKAKISEPSNAEDNAETSVDMFESIDESISDSLDDTNLKDMDEPSIKNKTDHVNEQLDKNITESPVDMPKHLENEQSPIEKIIELTEDNKAKISHAENFEENAKTLVDKLEAVEENIADCSIDNNVDLSTKNITDYVDEHLEKEITNSVGDIQILNEDNSVEKVKVITEIAEEIVAETIVNKIDESLQEDISESSNANILEESSIKSISKPLKEVVNEVEQNSEDITKSTEESTEILDKAQHSDNISEENNLNNVEIVESPTKNISNPLKDVVKESTENESNEDDKSPEISERNEQHSANITDDNNLKCVEEDIGVSSQDNICKSIKEDSVAYNMSVPLNDKTSDQDLNVKSPKENIKELPIEEDKIEGKTKTQESKNILNEKNQHKQELLNQLTKKQESEKSTIATCEPQTPNLLGVREMLKTPNRQQLAPKTPNFVGFRNMLRTPKNQALKECDEDLEGVEAMLTTPRISNKSVIHNDELNIDENTPKEQPTFTPRRSARRASMSADGSGSTLTPKRISKRRASISIETEAELLTPKRITKRRSSISIETDAALLTPKRRTPRVKTNTIFEETAVDDMGAIIEEQLLDTPAEDAKELNVKHTISVSLQVAEENTAINADTVLQPVVIEEDTCKVINHSKDEAIQAVIIANDSKACLENVVEHSDEIICEIVHWKSPTQDCNKNTEPREILDESDYEYGKEVKKLDAVKHTEALPTTPKSTKTLRCRTTRHNQSSIEDSKDSTETPKSKTIINIPETVKQQDQEKSSTSAETPCNLDILPIAGMHLKTPKSCSTPRSLKAPKMCSTPFLDGIKELMDTPTPCTPIRQRVTSAFKCTEDVDKSSVLLDHTADEGLDKFFTTPRAKRAMVLTSPKSVQIKKNTDSVELLHSTEIELNTTNVPNLEDIFKTPVAACFADDTINEQDDESKTNVSKTTDYDKVDVDNTLQHLSAEEAFDNLIGQSSSNQTPARKTYIRKSLTTSAVLQSPFSASDIISDLPKTDIQEWVDSLEDSDMPPEAVDDPEISIAADNDVDDSELARDPLLTDITAVNSVDDANDETKNTTGVTECMMNISKASSMADPLACSALLTGGKQTPASRRLSAVEAALPDTIEESEISGINLLDESGSMFSERLAVSDTDESSFDKTLPDADKTNEFKNFNENPEIKLQQRSKTPATVKTPQSKSRRLSVNVENVEITLDFQTEKSKAVHEKLKVAKKLSDIIETNNEELDVNLENETGIVLKEAQSNEVIQLQEGENLDITETNATIILHEEVDDINREESALEIELESKDAEDNTKDSINMVSKSIETAKEETKSQNRCSAKEENVIDDEIVCHKHAENKEEQKTIDDSKTMSDESVNELVIENKNKFYHVSEETINKTAQTSVLDVNPVLPIIDDSQESAEELNKCLKQKLDGIQAIPLDKEESVNTSIFELKEPKDVDTPVVELSKANISEVADLQSIDDDADISECIEDSMLENTESCEENRKEILLDENNTNKNNADLMKNQILTDTNDIQPVDITDINETVADVLVDEEAEITTQRLDESSSCSSTNNKLDNIPTRETITESNNDAIIKTTIETPTDKDSEREATEVSVQLEKSSAEDDSTAENIENTTSKMEEYSSSIAENECPDVESQINTKLSIEDQHTVGTVELQKEMEENTDELFGHNKANTHEEQSNLNTAESAEDMDTTEIAPIGNRQKSVVDNEKLIEDAATKTIPEKVNDSLNEIVPLKLSDDVVSVNTQNIQETNSKSTIQQNKVSAEKALTQILEDVELTEQNMSKKCTSNENTINEMCDSALEVEPRKSEDKSTSEIVLETVVSNEDNSQNSDLHVVSENVTESENSENAVENTQTTTKVVNEECQLSEKTESSSEEATVSENVNLGNRDTTDEVIDLNSNDSESVNMTDTLAQSSVNFSKTVQILVPENMENTTADISITLRRGAQNVATQEADKKLQQVSKTISETISKDKTTRSRSRKGSQSSEHSGDEKSKPRVIRKKPQPVIKEIDVEEDPDPVLKETVTINITELQINTESVKQIVEKETLTEILDITCNKSAVAADTVENDSPGTVAATLESVEKTDLMEIATTSEAAALGHIKRRGRKKTEDDKCETIKEDITADKNSKRRAGRKSKDDHVDDVIVEKETTKTHEIVAQDVNVPQKRRGGRKTPVVKSNEVEDGETKEELLENIVETEMSKLQNTKNVAESIDTKQMDVSVVDSIQDMEDPSAELKTCDKDKRRIGAATNEVQADVPELEECTAPNEIDPDTNIVEGKSTTISGTTTEKDVKAAPKRRGGRKTPVVKSIEDKDEVTNKEHIEGVAEENTKDGKKMTDTKHIAFSVIDSVHDIEDASVELETCEKDTNIVHNKVEDTTVISNVLHAVDVIEKEESTASNEVKPVTNIVEGEHTIISGKKDVKAAPKRRGGRKTPIVKTVEEKNEEEHIKTVAEIDENTKDAAETTDTKHITSSVVDTKGVELKTSDNKIKDTTEISDQLFADHVVDKEEPTTSNAIVPAATIVEDKQTTISDTTDVKAAPKRRGGRKTPIVKSVKEEHIEEPNVLDSKNDDVTGSKDSDVPIQPLDDRETINVEPSTINDKNENALESEAEKTTATADTKPKRRYGRKAKDENVNDVIETTHEPTSSIENVECKESTTVSKRRGGRKTPVVKSAENNKKEAEEVHSEKERLKHPNMENIAENLDTKHVDSSDLESIHQDTEDKSLESIITDNETNTHESTDNVDEKDGEATSKRRGGRRQPVNKASTNKLLSKDVKPRRRGARNVKDESEEPDAITERTETLTTAIEEKVADKLPVDQDAQTESNEPTNPEKTTKRKVATRGKKTSESDDVNVKVEATRPTRGGHRSKKAIDAEHEEKQSEDTSLDEIAQHAANVSAEDVEHLETRKLKSRKRNSTHSEPQETDTTHHKDEQPVSKRPTRKANVVVAEQRAETPKRTAAPRATRKASTLDVPEHIAEAAPVTPRRGRPAAGRRVAADHHEASDELTRTEASDDHAVSDGHQQHTSDENESHTTSRGRTRKPTARAQQFLEEERAKASTPKRKLLVTGMDSPTPQKLPARRGRKPSTIDTDGPVLETELVLTSKQSSGRRGRVGTRAADVSSEQSHSELEHGTEVLKAPAGRQHRKASTIESDVSMTSPPLAAKRGRVRTAADNEQDKATDSLQNEEESTTKRKVRGRKPTRKGAAVAEDADEDEDDEPLKKKKLDVVETVATVVTPQRTTARRGAARNAAATVTAPKDADEEAADEHDVEEEKPKSTRSRAARAPKAKDVPHVREYRIASTSTLDGHSDDEPEDEKPSTSVATANKRNAASRRAAIETQASTDSPAPKRSRRKPVAAAAASEDAAELATETTTRTRGGTRARKVVTFETQGIAEVATPAAAVTDDEDVAEVVTEAPKRATRNARRK